MSQAECVFEARAQLGEGPVWDERAGVLHFVDIEGRTISCFEPTTRRCRELQLDERVGFALPRRDGGLVCGLQSGLAFVDFDREQVERFATPEPDMPENRFNDAKCDPSGRLWAGTMDTAQVHATGVLYRIDSDLSVHAMDRGYVVTNGPAFSPDGRTMYHNDSSRRIVYAFDCDPVAGTLDHKRVFLQLTESDGFPDGMTVDSEGCVWLAQWGGSCVSRWTPEAERIGSIAVAAPQVTSCAFGGPDMKTLYITTARIGLEAKVLSERPLSGGVFALDVDVAGSVAERFAG